MYNGIINIYKEKGYTSHDVVARLRGILQQRKIGHTGTLDPDAEGVLPVCLGRGTRLCDMLTDKDKVYEAELLLGITTDTQDISGRIIDRRKVDVNVDMIYKIIDSFTGTYNQIPPMYSAIKVNGKKLYEIARTGQSIERKPRPVTIYDINIIEAELPYVRMTIHCSKGTYIRTLCHDIGEKAGCGGCMYSLKRTRVSGFTISQSLTLDRVEAFCREGRIDEYIIPVDQMFETYPAYYDNGINDKLISNGNSFRPDGRCMTGKVRIYNKDNEFVGIYEYDPHKDLYVPVKMFYDSSGEQRI